ncbi:hypothetical protein [Actinokineospora iranica]|uniref:LppP/LprE lipoprotein n=1 Tax=Actinokineospora iranica TaxID=1271860 RepID=A0A1G6LZF9_9PSEU|nr:hypothetical protein [Actinokineospora iranica]SDC48105.1 hypothetical protein SAMN05216174_102291 [Actinokineospora iranica]
MRRQRRARRVDVKRGRAGALVACAALLATACSTAVDGTPVAAAIPPLTATEAVVQSLLDLGEASLVRYQGTMDSASDDEVTFDVTAAASGEATGSVTLGGKPATVVAIDRSIYLKAGADFWAALSGVGGAQDKGTAVADRWVKVPGGLIGVDFAEVFAPESLSQDVRESLGEGGRQALSDAERVDVNGARAIKIATESGAVYLAENAPHGVVKIEQGRAGSTDPTTVKNLIATVSDASPEVARFYQDVTKQAGELTAPVDVLTTVEEGAHTFEGCGAASCSIVVRFTNTSKVAVKVSVRGAWQGDGAPLGACETQAGPIPPGQPGNATCTVNSPEWVRFFEQANSVPGNHPYSVEWSTVVLADAPDLSRITARAGAKPADAKNPKTEGSHVVYSIGYSGAGMPKVWKYGVASSKFWAEHADGQRRACLGSTQSVCRVDLVTATGDAVSAHGLLNELVAGYRSSDGDCPEGQWVGCKR